MSITFDNVHIKWGELRKYKKEWLLIFVVGIPMALLYEYWLFLPSLTRRSFPHVILLLLFGMLYDVTWGFIFGLGAGLVSLKTDFLYQIIMTYISGYIVYIAVIVLNGIITFNVLIFLSIGILLNIFGLMITIGVGCVLGYAINYYVNKKVLKTDEKEIEQRNYIDYRKI